MRFITPAQCRAARAILDWSQPDLAKECDIHVQTISGFESGNNTPTKRTLETITLCFEEAGIEFMEGDGLRRRLSEITRLTGAGGFETFLDDVYNTSIQNGKPDSRSEVFLSNVKHGNWIKWMGEEKWAKHVKRMTESKELLDVRIIVEDGDRNFPAKAYSQYKWFPKVLFNDKSFYSYSDKLAFLNFQKEEVEILIMRQKEFAEGYRNLFRLVWDYVAKTPKS